MQVTTKDVRFDSLALVTGAGGPLEAVTARPINGALSPTDLTVIGDVTPLFATFAGSAAILIVWSDPALADNRQPFQESQLLLWICTAAPAVAEQIHGIAYYLAGAPNVLIGVDMFDAPIRVDEEFDSVQWIATAP